jgi:hypothetical protein
MNISGQCSIVIEEDVVGIFKQVNGMLIRTAYNQTILLEEQGYEKLKDYFREILESENRDLKHEQELKDVKRDEYCKGYDDGYRAGGSWGGRNE